MTFFIRSNSLSLGSHHLRFLGTDNAPTILHTFQTSLLSRPLQQRYAHLRIDALAILYVAHLAQAEIRRCAHAVRAAVVAARHTLERIATVRLVAGRTVALVGRHTAAAQARPIARRQADVARTVQRPARRAGAHVWCGAVAVRAATGGRRQEIRN